MRSRSIAPLAAIGLCWFPTAAHAAWRVERLPVPPGAPVSYAEPGIAITGSLAVADAATANTGAPPTLWISRDGGATWAAGRDFDTTGASTGDADAAIAADGRLYALNLAYNPSPPAQPTNPTVLVYSSRDGSAWSGPSSFPPPHGSDQPDRPWLALDPHDAANVDVVNSEGGGNVVMWRSSDGGADFSGPYSVTGGANSQAGLALSSRPLFDPAVPGRLFVLYETAASEGLTSSVGSVPPYEFPITQIWLATSSDGGTSWTSRLVLDTAAASGSLRDATIGHLLVASAIDAAGNLYAAFSARESSGTETTAYLMHSSDRGTSWSDPVPVAAATKSNVMPALAVTPRGVAHLSWYGSDNVDFRSDQAKWVEMYAQSADPLAPHPAFGVEQISGSGAVHVGGIDTAGTTGSNLGANWGLRDFQSIAVDSCGAPHLVWANDNGPPATFTARPAQPGPACTARRTHVHRRRHRRHHVHRRRHRRHHVHRRP